MVFSTFLEVYIRLIECLLRSLLKIGANDHHTDLLGINRTFQIANGRKLRASDHGL
ncbi:MULTISPECIES: hypothetical protein [unclassified Roseofilum]|uniref:hypothetical protein n=1 Tax=unclassified Roseofilum TaxID=2620099 RepID=UPI001B03F23C|nr:MULTISPECIES: hypothetical protein [unclassified Roseofilum]MBP0011135.1 hypothetical protein [Roseofilum sp. Belize Diploria]MBP0034662.1 hypothetical protein [Roseofilum sp. Belize BBD 4]MBP0041474.1 hypothetical protein [Roseofilum sp. SBFL]